MAAPYVEQFQSGLPIDIFPSAPRPPNLCGFGNLLHTNILNKLAMLN